MAQLVEKNEDVCSTEKVLVSLGWLVVLRINIDLAIFQPYLDLEAGDYQSLKIQVARPGIEPRSSCSASQELNHSATAAPLVSLGNMNFLSWTDLQVSLQTGQWMYNIGFANSLLLFYCTHIIFGLKTQWTEHVESLIWGLTYNIFLIYSFFLETKSEPEGQEEAEV